MASLADRITKPENEMTSDGMETQAPSGNTSWADEATNAANASSAPPPVIANAEKEMNDMEHAQTDGASEPMGGTTGVIEPSYEVDVKLSDLQADPNDPLYSAKSFEELGL